MKQLMSKNYFTIASTLFKKLKNESSTQILTRDTIVRYTPSSLKTSYFKKSYWTRSKRTQMNTAQGLFERTKDFVQQYRHRNKFLEFHRSKPNVHLSDFAHVKQRIVGCRRCHPNNKKKLNEELSFAQVYNHIYLYFHNYSKIMIQRHILQDLCVDCLHCAIV